MRYDRTATRGFRLNIAAGTAVRFEPGQEREVELVALAGNRMVYGFRGQEMGPLDAKSMNMGVETGGCPRTAIREDASINLDTTFIPELSDLTIYVIDVAGGEKILRKGGPGITRSGL